MESVESPAMTGPVTAYDAEVMVSWPSFSARVMRPSSLSMVLMGTIILDPRKDRRHRACRDRATSARRENLPHDDALRTLGAELAQLIAHVGDLRSIGQRPYPHPMHATCGGRLR